jgi:hypothetical protein
VCGCVRRDRDGFERYVPAPATAKLALEAALEAWMRGQPPGPIDTVSPKVCVVDSLRAAGRPLERFVILGEVPADGARGFAVRVTLKGEESPTLARFLVVGIDPLWVYRQEDYENFSHWMHSMAEEKVIEK